MGSDGAAFDPLGPQDPDRLGPYVLLARLGAGAMGRVYLGRSAAGRLVAVKTIRAGFVEEADFRVRFAREAAAARRVSGVFTAAVVAADPDTDVPWLATAYVPAPSLSQLVTRCGPLPVPAVRWLAAGCAEALESIHDAGLVHRDLKPSNVLVAPDGPRVIDFGVARAVERIQLTATHATVGTPAYMAPEQARDTRAATVASDVFSLGSTLLFAASGHPPYRGETAMDVLVRLATEPPDLSGLPAELAELVASCLHRDPRRRPTPAALLAELGPYLDGSPGVAPGPSLPDSALTVIEEYRQRPTPAARPTDPPGTDATFGSRLLAPAARQPPGSAVAPVDHRLPGPVAALAARQPAGSARGSPAGRRSMIRAPVAALRRSMFGRPRSAARGPHRTTPMVVSIGAVAGLVVLGSMLGAWINNPGSGADQTSPRPPATAAPQDIPFGNRPPGLQPRPPLSGASDRPGGPPQLLVNQPFGDGNTVFVVHGRGWAPGSPVRVGLAGGAVSPDAPVADDAGSFNYAIDQDHVFFPGPIPPGAYTVVATGAGGTRAEISFTIHP